VSGECEMATGETQPPEDDRPAYVAGTLAIGEDTVDVLDLEALITSAPATIAESIRGEARS
jgi:hypothetical protein